MLVLVSATVVPKKLLEVSPQLCKNANLATATTARDYSDPMREAEHELDAGLDLLRWGISIAVIVVPFLLIGRRLSLGRGPRTYRYATS